jgi:hypothetical protein
MTVSNNFGMYKSVSASGNVNPASGVLVGIFVSAASSTPTITIYDSATTTTTAPIVTVFTPVAATFYPIPATYAAGLYVVISGTVACTVIYA